MKLIKKIKVTGTIELLTGLHIGASNDSMQIGGYDSVVVRNPLDNRPYIPGSSLKGKLRSLIEISDGTVSDKGNVTNEIDTDSVALFGNSSDAKDKTNYMCHASRLIVRDAAMINEGEFNNANVPLTEGKTEASINRITSKAMPRTFERVPRGAKFGLSMIINVMDFSEDIKKIEADTKISPDKKEQILSSFKKQSEANLKATLDRAFKLLADDYLGGQGSRGYGEVKVDYEFGA